MVGHSEGKWMNEEVKTDVVHLYNNVTEVEFPEKGYFFIQEAET